MCQNGNYFACHLYTTHCLWNSICTDTGDCSTTPCLNGGACTGGAGTFTCACVAGYAGSTCETSKLYILTDYIPIYIHYLGIKKQNKMKFLLVAHQEIINKEHTKRKKH